MSKKWSINRSRKPVFRTFNSCPDPKIITEPKTFDSQKIYGIFPGEVIIVDHGKIAATEGGMRMLPTFS